MLMSTVTPVEKVKNLISTFLAEFNMEGPLIARRLKLPLLSNQGETVRFTQEIVMKSGGDWMIGTK